MIRFILHLWILIVLVSSLTGCKKENQNPELIDPIWKDLSARQAAYKKNLDESVAKIPVIQESLSKSEPRSIDQKNFQKELAKEKLKLMNAQQLELYYRIRAERRKHAARISYKKAFHNDKAWPDPSEYSDYQVNIRLQESSRNWESRVPKLQDRLPSGSGVKAKAEKPAAAPGGH